MERIQKIAEEIRKEHGEEDEETNAWFFWSRNKSERKGLHRVGYYIPIKWSPNSKRIMFIAPNPSTGEYTDRKNKDKLRLFLDKLVEHDLAKRISKIIENTHIYFKGCFVTDLIKIRLEREEAKESLRKFLGSEWEYYLNREIEAVDPLLIVALGNDTYKVLKQLQTLNRPVEQIYHYGSLRFPQRDYKFSKQIERIRRVYNFLERRSS